MPLRTQIFPPIITIYDLLKTTSRKFFITKKNILPQAELVLKRNDVDGKIIAAPHLYPHQWLWDSCFAAIGLSHFDWPRAAQEINSLLDGQWKDGFIAHIKYDERHLQYWPDPKVWAANILKKSPTGILTSGITQPPTLALAAWQVFQNTPRGKSKEGIKFLKKVFPKIKKYHLWLNKYRDPQDIGLLYIIHPWESGLDNSPLFDSVINSIGKNIPKKIKTLVDKNRRDNKIVNRKERPTQSHYYAYIYLVDLFKKYNYNQKKIYQHCPFLVYDVLFNSIWAKSNFDLASIAEILALKREQKFFYNLYQQTKRALNKTLWNEENHQFFDFDLKNNRYITVKTISTFMPLYAKIPNNTRGKHLIEKHLLNTKEFLTKHPFASTSKDESAFDSQRYWRGPTWVIINWLMIKSLGRYGYYKEVKEIKEKTLNLIIKNGFREYFNSLNGQGLGDIDQSWSAALTIDLLKLDEN